MIHTDQSDAARRLVLGELAAVKRQDPHALAAEIRLSGTPVSEWRGHPPNGAEFTWETCWFYDLDEDCEHPLRERMYYDAAGLDRQLAAAANAG